jgi:protein kinase X
MNPVAVESDGEADLVPSGTKETRISDFEVLKTIGTGTFARVYLCRPKRGNKRSGHGGGSGGGHVDQNNYFALKVLSMHDVVRLKQVEHVKSEKALLLEINHPFLVDMIWHHKDSQVNEYA